MIVADRVAVRFLFDRHRRVVTPAAARLKGISGEIWGLRDVSIRMEPGSGYGLIGASGSGKTTLLRVLAGVYQPDSGQLVVRGRVASLLSIDAGLLSLLTGRENALHLGVLAGLSFAESRAALEQVRERSMLDEYFDRPVSSYSQGMRARLGFAVADERDPQILLLDEVHEALDHEFRNFLQERAHAILEAGGVVVAAGHDHPMLARLAGRAIWMDEGTIREEGPFEVVRRRYVAAVETGSS